MKRTALAAWRGGLQKGTGHISTQSGLLDEAPYGFKDRFEEGPGTNPEELIAAAHAGCFSMALAAQLGKEKIPADHLTTEATVTLANEGGHFSITSIHLDLVARVPGADLAAVERIANIAKQECPVSKLMNVRITLSVKLET